MSTKRSVLLLVVLLVSQLVTLAVQTEAAGGHGSLAEEVFLRGVAPFSRAMTAVRSGFAAATGQLRSWGELRRENATLRAEVEDLRFRLMRLYGMEDELTRLEEATAYRSSHAEAFLIADVVYSDTDSWLRNLIVYVSE